MKLRAGSDAGPEIFVCECASGRVDELVDEHWEYWERCEYWENCESWVAGFRPAETAVSRALNARRMPGFGLFLVISRWKLNE